MVLFLSGESYTAKPELHLQWKQLEQHLNSISQDCMKNTLRIDTWVLTYLFERFWRVKLQFVPRRGPGRVGEDTSRTLFNLRMLLWGIENGDIDTMVAISEILPIKTLLNRNLGFMGTRPDIKLIGFWRSTVLKHEMAGCVKHRALGRRYFQICGSH